jgi:copper/silver efflux system protein
MTVEGRERYPISVRYARDFRTDLDSLKRVLVPTPSGAQVPISLLADISYRTGPPSIREENAQLVGYVFVDITSSDIEGYVRAAAKEIAQKVGVV